jgi:hypothetical protein
MTHVAVALVDNQHLHNYQLHTGDIVLVSGKFSYQLRCNITLPLVLVE